MVCRGITITGATKQQTADAAARRFYYEDFNQGYRRRLLQACQYDISVCIYDDDFSRARTASVVAGVVLYCLRGYKHTPGNPAVSHRTTQSTAPTPPTEQMEPMPPRRPPRDTACNIPLTSRGSTTRRAAACPSSSGIDTRAPPPPPPRPLI